MDKKIEKITLPDGRSAERHITIDEKGDRTIEVYAEEKRPLQLETRITEKHKTVVAQQVIETIQDGQVVEQKVMAEPDAKLELREHIATVAQPELNKNRYLTREEIVPMISEAVVSGIGEVVKAQMTAQSNRPMVTKAEQAEVAVKNRVEEKKKFNVIYYSGVLVAVVAELAFLGYMLMR